jgi:glycosyltransferase involved in cell wall biosynthesis
MNILFISRKYPPIIGGMENYAYSLHKQFQKNHHVYSIILTKSQLNLIWFIPWCLLKGTFLVVTKKIDIVYIGDGVLSSVALYFQKFLRKNVVITIYGLDVIYNKFFYQKMIRFFLPKLKTIIAISHATMNEALKRGVDKNSLNIIPVGVDIEPTDALNKKHSQSKIQSVFNINTTNKKVLFTIGRLVKRKGVFWFVDNVIENLNDDFIFLIAGDGSEFEKINSLIKSKNLNHKVYLLGRISESNKNLLFSASDAFISPNITIKNDMEGFGIVNLEAGLYGLPVVASNIEGVKDAVHENVTGFLVPEHDVTGYVDAINKIDNLNPIEIKNYVQSNFSWESIYLKYKAIFHAI